MYSRLKHSYIFMKTKVKIDEVNDMLTRLVFIKKGFKMVFKMVFSSELHREKSFIDF